MLSASCIPVTMFHAFRPSSSRILLCDAWGESDFHKLWRCAGWRRLQASFSWVARTQPFVKLCAVCTILVKVICSDALKIHLANQMIWVYSRKLGMTVWPNVLRRVQSSSQLDLKKCCIPHQKAATAAFQQNSFESILLWEIRAFASRPPWHRSAYSVTPSECTELVCQIW